MTRTNDTIRVLIPLKLRRKNGRPKILPPADYRPSEDRTPDPHVLRAIGRAWAWRRRLERGDVATLADLAADEGISDRFVSRQLRLAYLAPEVLRALLVERRTVGVTLPELAGMAEANWVEQWNRIAG